MSYSELLSNFCEISFKECLSEGISHPVFYGDLVYKLWRVKCEANFFSSGSKIVKRLRRRKYDPMIIDREDDRSCAWPFYSLVQIFLKHYTSINKTVRTIWRHLSKSPQRRQWSSFPLIVSLNFFRPWMSLYIFDILFLSSFMFVL